MMLHFALVAVFLQPVSTSVPPISGDAAPICAETRSITAGVLAPCTGILWSTAQTREALKCAEVRVPLLEADLKRATDLCQVQQLQAQRNVEFRDKIINQMLQQHAQKQDEDAMSLLFAFALGTATGVLTVVLVK